MSLSEKLQDHLSAVEKSKENWIDAKVANAIGLHLSRGNYASAYHIARTASEDNGSDFGKSCLSLSEELKSIINNAVKEANK